MNLLEAVATNNLEEGKKSLADGADVNKRGGLFDETALMWASTTDNTETVKALLAAGANVKAKDHAGRTALMRAKANNHTEIVKLLKAAGAKE